MSQERLLAPEIFFKKFPPSFDHDGVLADTRRVVVEKYNKDFGKNHSVEEVTHFKTIAFWAMTELGLSEVEADALDKRYWYQIDGTLITCRGLSRNRFLSTEGFLHFMGHPS